MTTSSEQPSPLDALRGAFGTQLDALAGSVISGSIPFAQAVVNRLIAQRLDGTNGPIAAAEVQVGDADRFVVRLRPRAPLPLLNVDARIVEQPHLPDRATLGLQWTLRGLGPLAFLAAPVMSYFKVLPPGIRVEGDRLWIDLFTLLRSRGLGDLVPLIHDVRVTTQEGRFVVAFELRR